MVGCRDEYDNKYWMTQLGRYLDPVVTIWMPLPPAPKETLP